jgi:hypothetical protein
MTKPQQPEIRRSGRGATDQDSAKTKVADQPNAGRPHGTDKGSKGGGHGGGVPDGQRPPHPS